MVSLEYARRNFLHFRRLVNPKLILGWWQVDCGLHLMQFAADLLAGKRPQLIIQAPPQHGKSLQVIEFMAWLAGLDPDIRKIYTSFSERLGIRANLRLQRMFDSSIYREIFPGTKINQSNVVTISGQYLRNREILEYVSREGYFRNTTVRGSITGESLDLGILDDPIRGRADANSETVRNAVWDWLTDDFMTRFSERSGLLAILTRWHVDDPIGRLLIKDPSIKVLTYKAVAIQDELHRKRGDALFPELKSAAFLSSQQARMDVSSWESLYQQNPFIAEGALFKPAQIEIVDALPAEQIKWVRGWDFAASDNVGSDYTAGAKLGRLSSGRFVIGDVERGQYMTDNRDTALVNTAKADGATVLQNIPQDPGSAGKSLALYLTRALAGHRVKASPETGDKVTRAEPFAAQVNVGNVIMLRGSWNYALIEELRMFPNGKHDDQVDALSRAFNDLAAGMPGQAVFDMLQEGYTQLMAKDKQEVVDASKHW